MKKRIAILTGGTSSEREIALASAKGVREALGDRYEVSFYDFPNDIDKFLVEYRAFEAVVPVFHGRGGEDGVIQGFLRTLGVPFVFSDIEAQALAANKVLAKHLVSGQGIATPKAVLVRHTDELAYLGPVVVKPHDGGSSIGVAIAKDENAFRQALAGAFKLSSKVLVEDFVEGDEFTVPVAHTADGILALPIIEIRSKNEFFDLASKYDPTQVDEICPACISEELASRLKDAAVKAHQAISARHISRSDFIVDKNGGIWFLEINTIPGQTVSSLFPKAVKTAGLNFGDLISFWIESL
jgi:D-alanine-D-alanine ligase